MPVRKITYELKLKNIKHLLYGKQDYTKLDQGVRYYPVREEEKGKLSDVEFLLRHFGSELLPGIESASRQCLTDLMGRDGIESPWRYGSVGFVDALCSKLGGKEVGGNYPNVDALVERNRKLLEEREGQSLAASLGDYIVHIRGAEAEVYADYRIPGPQLDMLLGYAEDCLTAYDRRKDPEFLAMALSWLLVGALTRTRITGLSSVLEYYRKALRWDEVGAIPKEQVLGSREQGLEEDVAAGLCRKLRTRLEEERDSHPSFRLMNDAYGLDRELIPRGSLLIPVSGRVAELDEGRKDGTEPGADTNGGKGPGARTLADFIRVSRQPGRRKHVTIEGEGGIGKTVALLSLALEPGIFPEGVPVIYVPLHRLNQERFKPEKGEGRLDLFIGSCLRKECRCTDGEADAFHELCRQDGPGIVLLLDGYNEVLEGLKRQVRMEINEWAAYPGVQIITTSRTPWSCGEDFMMIRLRPLDEDTIRGYLERAGAEIPRQGDSLWRVIDYPLMLTLYTHISAVRRQAGKGLSAGTAGGLLDMRDILWRPMNRAGDIIWNYLQKELARCAEELDIGTDDSFLEACAVAVLHTAPYIAWRMSRADAFFIPLEEEGSGEGQPSFAALVRESIVCLGKAWDWPGQLKGIINEHGRRRWMRLAGDPDPDRLFDRAERIERLLLNEVSLFRVREDAGGDGYGPGGSSREVEMMHQQFRDGLAAVWLCQRIGAMETPAVLEKGIFRSTGDKYALPLCWREKIGRYVLKFAAEVMDEREAGLFWEAGRVYQPSAVKYAYTMLNLMSERSVRNGVHENDFRNLDFSGMDLKNISLFSYKKEGCLKLQLSRSEDPGRMAGTMLAKTTFETQGHTGRIQSVSISRDGKRAVSSGHDGTLRVWDLENMICEKVLEGHNSTVWNVSVSKDGKRAVSGGDDGTVRVWNLEGMVCEKEWEGHKGGVFGVSISADGKRAVSCGNDRTVRVWDLQSMTCRMAQKMLWEVGCVSVSSDGKRAVGGDSEGSFYVWNLETMTCEEDVFEVHAFNVSSVSISGDGKRAVSNIGDSLFYIWDLETMTCEFIHGKDFYSTRNVSISEDGKRVVSGHNDGIVRIWNLETMTCEKVLEGHNLRDCSVSVSGDGKRAVSGGSDGSFCVWNLETMTCEKEFEGFIKIVHNGSVSGDGKRATSRGSDSVVRIWNLETKTCEKVLEGCRDVTSIDSFSIDGKRIVCEARDGNILVRDLETMTCKKIQGGHKGVAYSVSVSGDGKRAIGGGRDGSMFVWNLENMTCEKELEWLDYTVNSVSINGNGMRAVSGGKDGFVCVWNLESMICEKKMEGHFGEVNSVSISWDGKLAVSGGFDRVVRVWNLKTKTCEKELEGHKGVVSNVSISGDGKRAMSGDIDGRICVWNLETMVCEKVLVPLPGIDIVGIDLFFADFESEETKEILRQNGAIINMEKHETEIPKTNLLGRWGNIPSILQLLKKHKK